MILWAPSFSISVALRRRCRARSRRSFRRCSWPVPPSIRSLRHEPRPTAERRAWQHADICGSASTASTDAAPTGPSVRCLPRRIASISVIMRKGSEGDDVPLRGRKVFNIALTSHPRPKSTSSGSLAQGRGALQLTFGHCASGGTKPVVA